MRGERERDEIEAIDFNIRRHGNKKNMYTYIQIGDYICD